MTVAGNEIIENCRKCFAENGYGIRLEKSGSAYHCPQCKTRYDISSGMLRLA
jgi:hypothetical protein